MRKLLVLAAGSFLALATAAGAQDTNVPAEPTPAPQPAPSAPATPQAPTIQSVNIVDVSELPAETQSQVDKIEKDRSPADLQKLRSSIDATPEIASALQSKGLTSADVVVASLNSNGAVTLVTRKAPG